MKNFGLLLLGVILGALAMYFYCSDDLDVTDPPEIIKPEGVITSSQIKVLDAAYSIRHRIISDSLFRNAKTSDNRSSWWSLKDIQNYISYAENQAGDLGYTMDGLRVYLGAYPNVDGGVGLTSMFFVPTGYKNTSEGSMISIQDESNDIEGADGLNKGSNGHPPGSNYPQ